MANTPGWFDPLPTGVDYDQWVLDQEAKRLRNVNKAWMQDMQYMFHILDPAKFSPPGATFEPDSLEQEFEEKCARVEQQLAELVEMINRMRS